MAIRVSDAMTRRIVYASPQSNVLEIAHLMRDQGISSIIIQEGGRIVGIVTEHDLVQKVLSVSLEPSSAKASEVMSKPVQTIDSEADIEEAARIMRDRRIKKLIALEGGEVKGIVSSFDIIAAEPVIRLLVERGI